MPLRIYPPEDAHSVHTLHRMKASIDVLRNHLLKMIPEKSADGIYTPMPHVTRELLKIVEELQGLFYEAQQAHFQKIKDTAKEQQTLDYKQGLAAINKAAARPRIIARERRKLQEKNGIFIDEKDYERGGEKGDEKKEE